MTQFKRKETLSGLWHSCIQKWKQNNHSPYHIVYPEILHPKYVQHHPRGIQRHRHDQQHTDVQHNRVFSYAAGIFWGHKKDLEYTIKNPEKLFAFPDNNLFNQVIFLPF